MKRKIIQITVLGDPGLHPEVPSWQIDLCALCDDGSIWVRNDNDWNEIDISQINPSPLEGA
jgi:hypothetical protein